MRKAKITINKRNANRNNGTRQSVRQNARNRITFSKGYVYTMEVMLAVVTIMFMLIFLFNRTPVEPETSLSIIKETGYDALFFLDQAGDLGRMVSQNRTSEIKNNITALIPQTIVTDVAICSPDCIGNVPYNRTVVSVDYYVAGYQDMYIGKKVRLWMWQKY